jgi:hypothetical protein
MQRYFYLTEQIRERTMDELLISIATGIASVLALGILSYISYIIKKLKNEHILSDIKIDALVHTIEKKLINGSILDGENFSACYYTQVERLMKEHNFVVPKHN